MERNSSGGGEISEEDSSFRGNYYGVHEWENYSGGGSSEIQEMSERNGGRETVEPLESITEEYEGFDDSSEEAVYVAVGKQSEETSMDALCWAVSHALSSSSTVVYLIHVFPETKHIPTPLGKLPISQVNPEQKENFMAQERGKRGEFLQKFLTICAESKVKAETILIESDAEAKAILELVPILNIRKLVLGITKSNLRRMQGKKGNGGLTEQIVQNIPEFCEVKVICEGKEMTDMPVESSPSPSPSPSPSLKAFDHVSSAKLDQDRHPARDTFACGCFSIK
ncbi:U-box domain-containing protein 35 [Andrographis paniculata]|uniref:U-box domain-containing protein 35 n=1 Tax=Andrographis paniculata TaxID=175694 RepID=UPI0021E7EDCD|nr:U-box domain-containing protein 35 [Andrographis paniculata]